IGLWPAGHEVDHLVAWDRDGAGPQPARLVGARGGIVRVWDGAQWEQLPSAPGVVSAVAAFDPDHAGPAPPLLYATVRLVGEPALVVLEDGVWRSIYSSFYGVPSQTLRTLDPDGAGPEPEALYFNTHHPF